MLVLIPYLVCNLMVFSFYIVFPQLLLYILIRGLYNLDWDIVPSIRVCCCLMRIPDIVLDLCVGHDLVERRSHRLLKYQIRMLGVLTTCQGYHEVCCYHFYLWL